MKFVNESHHNDCLHTFKYHARLCSCDDASQSWKIQCFDPLFLLWQCPHPIPSRMSPFLRPFPLAAPHLKTSWGIWEPCPPPNVRPVRPVREPQESKKERKQTRKESCRGKLGVHPDHSRCRIEINAISERNVVHVQRRRFYRLALQNVLTH